MEKKQAVTNAHTNTNQSGPTSSHKSLASGSFSKSLAISVNFLSPTKSLFDSEHMPFTSSKLRNGQSKPTNVAQVMEMPTKCLICGHPANCCHYDVPSCDGCKAFFHRSLFASKTYACKLNGMCTRLKERHSSWLTSACLNYLIDAVRVDLTAAFWMNLRAMQFPASIDVAKLFDKVSNRRRILSQKYGERCPVLTGTRTGPVFEETIEGRIIQSLVYVELKVRKIRESSRWLSESVIRQSIQKLLDSNHENVLAHADQYPKELKWPLTIDEAVRLEGCEGRPNGLMLDMFLCIEMARIMPVFSQLDYNDQEALLKQMILANTILLQAFYSSQMKSETIIMPNGFLPTKQPKFDRLNRLMERVKLLCCRIMVAISRIQMNMEEFVLLKAVIYSHSAIHELSERGKVLLEKESIRYSKTLMKHLQLRMGDAPGAKKYAEIISFVDCLFHTAQQLREIHVYIAAVDRSPHYIPPYMKTIMYA